MWNKTSTYTQVYKSIIVCTFDRDALIRGRIYNNMKAFSYARVIVMIQNIQINLSHMLAGHWLRLA